MDVRNLNRGMETITDRNSFSHLVLLGRRKFDSTLGSLEWGTERMYTECLFENIMESVCLEKCELEGNVIRLDLQENGYENRR